MPINNADNTNQQTKWDSLWVGVNLACMSGDSADSEGKNCNHNPVGIIMDAAIAIKNGRIAWLGKADQLASEPYQCAHVVHDGNGQWLTPGLIDCHTHLVFAGNRAAEFEQRLNGVSYADIAKAGGGIRSTVAATRAASEDELLVGASQRIAKLCKEGVTTIEIKSGYGLSTDHECRMLKVAKSLQAFHSVNISTTFLGAHAIPQEYQDHRQAYVDSVCNDMLPKVAEQGLADAVDAFCETVGFSLEETRQIFSAAKELGLPIKLHADQLSDSGGGALAAEFGALSADHIEYTGQESVKAMAKAGTVGVLLPGAYYFLRETQLPPIEHLRAYNVPMAIASDANPGSSPTVSLLLMLNMACTMFHLTPSEALAGVTINAAKALGLEHDRGSLDVGKRADLALWDVQDLAELCYWIGNNPCTTVIKDGQIVEN